MYSGYVSGTLAGAEPVSCEEWMMTNPTIVSGAVSTVSELGKDEGWMQGWLSDDPARLGLGDLEVTDGAADDEEHTFVATDDERCFSVDVQLGEMEASRGFAVLDNWARNRVLHPDKEHVAVLVTEAVSDRYRTTLTTLAEHLPLVVIELQVWKGENEAIVVPHVALSSDDVDLSDTPAAKAAGASARATAASEPELDAESEAEFETHAADDGSPTVSEDEPLAAQSEDEEGDAEESDADEGGADDELVAESPDDKDDTGVGNPWGLPQAEDEGSIQASDNGSTGLLTKIS